MSISFSGSTLTFSDSTTMTTAASLIAGPTGPTGATGPTGPAGSNASVVTTYGAVGSYVVAYGGNFTTNCTYVATNPGCTFAAACLHKKPGSSFAYGAVSMNIDASTQWGGTPVGAGAGFNYCPSAGAQLGISGTWRSMTYGYTKGYNLPLNLFVRIS